MNKNRIKKCEGKKEFQSLNFKYLMIFQEAAS